MDVGSLAGLAGDALVTAAVTDAWESLRHQVARLFGRGQPDPAIERRLEETRRQLISASAADVQRVTADMAGQWRTRFADLLADCPDATTELESLVREITASFPAANDHSIAAAGDVSVRADRGGVAAGVVHGNITMPGHAASGPGGQPAWPGFTGQIGSGSVVASHGGVAIGTLVAALLPEPARLPVSLPARPPLLAGREELLAELHGLLTEGERPRTVVLCGLGGVGKTSLAAEYAHRHLGEVAIAWQVAAENAVVLVAELAELAAQVGARQIADPRDPIASVHAVLAASPADWLLIFDNAPDEASVRKLLPPAGRGRVLVTSQSPLWPSRRVLEVPTLDDDVAAQFLISRTGNADPAAARALAAELGGLPLALEQAASYMRATATALAGYLALFRERRAVLLDRGEAAGHPATVAATLALALARIAADAPASRLLRLLACLAPEPVPIGLLLSDGGVVSRLDTAAVPELGPLLSDRLAVSDAVAALRSYSLITPAGDELVMVHRLVQAVVLDQMPGELTGRWRHIGGELIDAAIPGDITRPEVWPACALLLPHAQAVLAKEGEGIARIAEYLGESGSYAAARDLWRQIVEARTRAFGHDDPRTLDSRAEVAWWTGAAGDPAAARQDYAALLPIRARVSGPEHGHTLTDRANLARWTGEAGDPATARDLYAALLPAYDKVFGLDNPRTLATRGNLAWWTGKAGDPAAARDLYAALAPARERVLGPEHPDALADRASLADWTAEAGDPATARDIYAALIPEIDRILGEEHPNTLDSHARFASFTGQAGDPETARAIYAELLQARERLSGPEHPDTAADRASLAYWTSRAKTES